jgi:hypothetical protein
MQMLNQQPFIQEVLMQKHLQDHEESKIQSLVVNLPMNNSTTCQTIAFQVLRLTPKRRKTKTRAKR